LDKIDRILSAPPFALNGPGNDWVRSTLAGMDRAAKVRQLFVHICFGTGPEVVERITALAPAGVTKFFGLDAGAELDTLDGSDDVTVLLCASSQSHLGTLMPSGGGHIIRAHRPKLLRAC